MLADSFSRMRAIDAPGPSQRWPSNHDISGVNRYSGCSQLSDGHPVAVAAGLAAINAYREPGFYEHIGALATRLYAGLNEILARHQVAGRVQGLGARFGIYFGVTNEVRSYRDAVKSDRETMLKFVAAAIGHGVYFHDYGGAACHHGFCAAMTVADVDDALTRLDGAVRSLRA
jgi:glutamate-1-semialdehyde 2,1-aminomutase